MASIELDIRCVDFADLPWSSPGDLLTRLGGGDVPAGFPLLGDGDRDHVSGSPFLDRRRLAAVLAEHNASVHNALSGQQTQAIADDARFVITGQQPGLLLGPLYAFLKAVTAIRLAEHFERLGGGPVIPAFWIASEDHDVLEVNRCTVAGRTFTWDYPGELAHGEVPQVGDIPLDEAREPLLDFLAEALPATEFREGVLETVAAADFTSYATLFATLMRQLLGPGRLVLIDPIGLRSLTAPVLAEAVARWPAVLRAFDAGATMLRAADVDVALDRAGLFEIVEGKRRACDIDADGMTASAGRLSLTEAAAEIRRRPADFSPNAALRPVLQDAVIPTLTTVGGPAELRYLWQIGEIYEAVGVQRSRVAPRIHATFVEPPLRRAADKAGLWPDRLLDAPAALRDYNPQATADPDLDRVQRLGDELLAAIEGLKDGHSDKQIGKAHESIAHQVERLVSRLREHRLSRAGLGRQNLEKVVAALLPDGRPQERVVSPFHFLGFHGPDFVSRSLERLDPWCRAHQVAEIVPRRGQTGGSA